MDNRTYSPLNDIHIAVAFDNNYKVHIYPMVASVLYNNKKNSIVFHAIATGINNDEKAELYNFIKEKNGKILFYDINEYLQKAEIFIPSDSYFTIATFYRLFFASILDPSLKKLLYIDPDTIVIGDLRELYETELLNFAIAAVPDSGFEAREELGIVEKGKYFNAGVMLIDLQNWKEQKVSERVLAYISAYPDRVPYLDQDGLNAILIDKWLKLDNKYNFISSNVMLQVPARELVRDKVIIHFTSSRKPWNFLTRNKLRYLYHYYLRRTPKGSEKNYSDFNWNIDDVWTFVRIRMKETYFNLKLQKILPIKKWIDSSDPFY